jgi:site-specific DNA recombinase
MPSQAIIYTRTSTAKQTDHQAQEDACRRWAESVGLEVREVYSETISGAAEIYRRDGLTSAINSLNEGDTLVIFRRDRMGRDVIKNAIIESLVSKAGARLHSLDIGDAEESNENTLLKTLLDAFAQYERSVTMARVKNTVESKRERGLCIGNTKLGETKVERDGLTYVEHDEVEAEKLNLVRSWRAQGLTYEQIRERCIEEGIETRKGAAPSISAVRSWVHDVELAPSVEAEKVDRDNSKRGRKKGYRGERAEDKDLALKALLISYIKEGISQAEMKRRLDANNITNSRGNSYAKGQIQRFVSRLKAESQQ